RQLACPAGTIFTEPAGEKHANFIVEDGALVVVLQPQLDAERLGDEGVRLLEGIHHFKHGRIAASAR
ncbi:MAG: hypothetical protein GWN71_17960, partial [Gammaproteobacteria bacterium]|nr:hypothetical protein [Gammaproteobacteria bacterium]